MLTDETIKVYGQLANLGHRLGLHPYSYSRKNGKFYFNNSRGSWYRLIISVTITSCYAIFLFVRSIQTLQHNLAPRRKFRSVYLTAIYIMVNFNHWITVRHYGCQHSVINAILNIRDSHSRISSKGGNSSRNGSEKIPKTDHIARLFRFVIAFCLFGTISRASGVYRQPWSFELFTSLSSNPRKLSMLWKSVAGLMHLYITGFTFYVIPFHGFVTLMYVCAVLPILDQTKIVRNGTSSHHVNWSSLALYYCYNRLSALSKTFSSVYGPWPMITEIVLILFSTVNLSLGVLFESVRFLMLGVSSMGLLIRWFNGYAEVYATSSEAVKSWNERRTPNWFPKFHKSARPIRVNIGSFFFVDKKLILTILAITMNNTTSLILSYREA